MVNHSGAFMDRKKKCYEKMEPIPYQIMVTQLRINAFFMTISLISCHIKRILPPLVMTLSWFGPKFHRMENQCIPYGA